MSFPLSFAPLPDEPLVSVLIASYNYARFLPEALDSLLAQTYVPAEIIICDDGSTDDSCAIAARYAQKNAAIRLIQQANGGVASALNAAYARSSGEVICLLDADDVFGADKLAAVVAGFRQHPRSGLLIHALEVVDATGGSLHRVPGTAPAQGWIAEALRRRGGRWRNLPASALSFRRALAEHLFPIPEADFRSEADGFLFTLAPLLAEVAYLSRSLGCYRLHGANLTGTAHIDAATARQHLDALQRINAAVNARLHHLQPDAPVLDLHKHLNVREQQFTLQLLKGTEPARLWPDLVALIEALWADDLYSPGRKLLGSTAYFTAMFVPVARRAAWLSWMLGARSLRRGLSLGRPG